jgi:6-phosphofructokinase 2
MSDIITITLNPAIDKTYKVNDLVPEHKLRCANPVVEAGGGGINVSKGLKELGSSSLAVFFKGGRNGEHLQEMLQHEQVECKPIMIQGETRESLIIIDQSTAKEFRIVVEGPEINVTAFQEILGLIETKKPEWIIASGSLPRGLPINIYALLAKTARSINSNLILDTSGDALEAALTEGVYMMKPNLKELSSLSGVESLKPDQAADAAQKLISEGKAEVIIVSMSAAGAMLVTKGMHHHIHSPQVEQRSTVGAGDSMVSGMVWALQQKKDLMEMICWGIACGSAATMNGGTQLFKKTDAEELFSRIRKKVNI